jgi:hypothetical protein
MEPRKKRGEKIEEKEEKKRRAERDTEGKRKTMTFLLFCCPVVLILHYFLGSNTYSSFSRHVMPNQDEVPVLVCFFEFFVNLFWCIRVVMIVPPDQIRNLGSEQVAAGVRFEKVREPGGRRVGVVGSQPALNVVVHGTQ